MEIEDFLIKTAAALLAGIVIGTEREIRGKDAGIKTNGLVALGAAVFVFISFTFYGEKFVDHTRVLGQIITGIGFLGAGVIMHKNFSVKGLTTAATLWSSAAAGCLAALGFFKELLLLSALIVSFNFLFSPVGKLLKRVSKKKERQN